MLLIVAIMSGLLFGLSVGTWVYRWQRQGRADRGFSLIGAVYLGVMSAMFSGIGLYVLGVILIETVF